MGRYAFVQCKKYGDISYLTSEALENLTVFGFNYPYCNTINRITPEKGVCNLDRNMNYNHRPSTPLHKSGLQANNRSFYMSLKIVKPHRNNTRIFQL
jgi:hypothetical protein